MTTFNTGNPIGSTAVKDLYDNAENLDVALHTPETTWVDRLGKTRRSWAGSTGYELLGDYEAGITVTSFNQIIRGPDGEFWRASAGTTLPYVTTGEGLPEDGAFVSVGDATLREQLSDDSDPLKGSAMVALPGGGVVADLVSPEESKGPALLPYKGRSQFSRNQDRPHIFDFIPASQHAAIINNASSYDAASDFEAAIAEVGEGGTIWLPAKGTIHSGSINVDEIGITIVGENASAGYYQSRIMAIEDGAPLFNVTQPQFSLRGISLWGLSNTVEKGEDITQDAILLTAPTQNNNLDAVFHNCVFSFFRDCIDMRGRNIRVTNTLFSNSRRAVTIGAHSLADVRGLEMYDNRYHSMGKTGSSNTACIWIDPAANFLETVIKGGDADDCSLFFNGFSSALEIDILQSKARGSGVVLNAAGHGIGANMRSVRIRGSYFGANPATAGGTGLHASGTMILDADVNIIGTSGHGMYIDTPLASIRGRVANAGQLEHNSYSALWLTANATNCLVDGFTAQQDTAGTVANKAQYGIRNDGASNYFGDSVRTIGAFGTAGFGPSAHPLWGGFNPSRASNIVQTWGAAAPTTGTWARGSICWNLGPAPGSWMGWVCTTAGTPGTWALFGHINT